MEQNKSCITINCRCCGYESTGGGDGITVFALPDLRNVFLRGYHGETEEQ